MATSEFPEDWALEDTKKFRVVPKPDFSLKRFQAVIDDFWRMIPEDSTARRTAKS